MKLNCMAKITMISNRVYLLCFLVGVAVVTLLLMSPPVRRNLPALPKLQALSRSGQPENDVHSEKPALPPVQSLNIFAQTSNFAQLPKLRPLSDEELTQELTKRLNRPSSDRKVVYEVPCDNSKSVQACVGPCQHPLTYSPKETIEKLTKSPELRLDEKMQQAVSTLGAHIPDSDLIIASAVSSNHFDEMQAMFESLHTKVYPVLEERIQTTKLRPQLLQPQNKVAISNFTMVLFDIGLSPAERIRTQKNCRCKIITFRKDLFPNHVSTNGCYSWKPLIMMAASQHARKLILWQDSSVRWYSSFLDNLDRAYTAGHQVIRYTGSHRIPANTLKEMFNYMHEDACSYLPYPEIQGNLHIHRSDGFNKQVLFEPWARCAVEKSCICPRPPESVLSCSSGTLHRCHRFDQSSMGMLLSRMYQKELYKIMFQEFVYDQEKAFRVARGSTNKNYFKS